MKMLKTFGLLTVLTCGGMLGAAENSYYLRVNVPFAFVVAGQQFGPGEYDVKETATGIITVQGVGKAAAVISTPVDSKQGETSSLRFTNSEGNAYLAGVSVEGEGTRAVPVHLVHERKVTVGSR